MARRSEDGPVEVELNEPADLSGVTSDLDDEKQEAPASNLAFKRGPDPDATRSTSRSGGPAEVIRQESVPPLMFTLRHRRSFLSARSFGPCPNGRPA